MNLNLQKFLLPTAEGFKITNPPQHIRLTVIEQLITRKSSAGSEAEFLRPGSLEELLAADGGTAVSQKHPVHY